MVLFEGQRFSTFFERESSKIPQLSMVSEYVENASDITGLSVVTQIVNQLAKDFSQEYIINGERPMGEQLTGFINQYTHYDFSQAIARKTQSIADANNKAASGSDSSATQITQPETAHTRNEISGVNGPDSIYAALIDKNMTAEKLVEQKKDNPKKISSFDLRSFFRIKQDDFYYNPRNSSPAPSRFALRQYKSVLPDYGKKNKVLIVGDSMMLEGLGPALHATLRKRSDLNVIREGRYSSGLSRPDFYDWPENLIRLIDEYEPHLIIVSMGANDTQDIVINTNRHFIDTESWKRVYGIRTYNYLNIAAAEKRQVLWVSLPIMGLEPYYTRTKRISKIQEQVSSYFDNVTFVNIEHLLTKDKKFVSFIRDKDNKNIRLRQKDYIHVSREGGQILTNYILPRIQENIDSIRYDEVNRAPILPVSGQENHVVFSSELRNKETEYVIYLPKPPKEKKMERIESAPDKNPIDKNPTKADINSSEELTVSKKIPSIPALIRTSMETGDERFPVLYLLHGASGSAKSWNESMGKELQKIADEKRVIIVAPSAEPFGWYVDSPLVAQNQIESYMVKELVPHIDMLYPTNKKRAIAGLSMGGHGAMLLGFKYPKIFSSVASASGVLDIRLHPEQWEIKDLLGNLAENKSEWDENSVVAHIGTRWKKYAPKQILIVTGTEDFLVLEDNRLAEKLLKERKFIFEYNEASGNHDWNFWREHIPNQLRKQADYLHGISE